MALKIVLTGGPGTGKTTIMAQLDALGHECHHEISRQIILEGQKNGVEQLFLEDPLAFSKALFKGRKTQYLRAQNSSNKQKKPAVFFFSGFTENLS
jgi:predicted ATPase